jgi:DnaJ-class molecular chaperone
MRKKDYYAILGISRTACIGAIRAAFRKLAKKHHPDLSGPEETRRFQEIMEAYTILSDLEARERYDKSLRGSEERTAQREKARRYAGAAGFGSSFSEYNYSSGEPNPTKRPFFVDDFFESLSIDSYETGFPGSRPEGRDELDVEVILSREEADHGGILPLPLPIAVRCPFCRGVGHTGLFTCTYCYGRGSVVGKEAVRVRIPSGVNDGATLEIRVNSHGTAGVLLRIHIRVNAA